MVLELGDSHIKKSGVELYIIPNTKINVYEMSRIVKLIETDSILVVA